MNEMCLVCNKVHPVKEGALKPCIGCDKVKPEHARLDGFCGHCGDVMEAVSDATDEMGGLTREGDQS